MDATKFGPSSPGQLVSTLTLTGQDVAFIPEDLPARWSFDDSLWPHLVNAKEALGTLNGIGQTLPEPGLLLRPLQNREAITSSNIEGTFVTPEQLLLFEMSPADPEQTDDHSADSLEVSNYSRSLQHGQELLKSMPVCNRVIKEMHAILMTGVRGRDQQPGKFRMQQVQIGSDSKFVPPPPSDVERLMANLEQYLNATDTSLDPLVRCFIVHYQFETIHPFLDGNGRIGRALIALLVCHWLNHSAPWLYMSAFFERFKDEYMSHLFAVSAQGRWTDWIRFCLNGVAIQANDAIARCHDFIQLRKDFHARMTGGSVRSHAIIESLFASPVVQVATIAEQFNVSYPTARADINLLVNVGILQPMKGARPLTFCAPEILKSAYDPEFRRPSVPLRSDP